MKKPLVSVVLPVYNGDKYIKRAVDSILNQTYENFELIVINDGSKDGTLDILKSFEKKDKRVKVVSRENKGLIYTLNEGFSLAKGTYLARQDDDDFSYPCRLEKQVEFMESNSKYAMCGTAYNVVDEDFKHLRKYYLPVSYSSIKSNLFDSCFGHGTVMIRKSMIEDMEWYRKDVLHVEDYDFFIRIAKKYPVYNLPDFLYDWTFRKTSVSFSNFELQRYNKDCVKKSHTENLDLPMLIRQYKPSSDINSYNSQMGDVEVLKGNIKEAIKLYSKKMNFKLFLKIVLVIFGGRKMWLYVLENTQKRKYAK